MHTNPWSDAIPLGSEVAAHIDDAIRQLRLDIHERMADLVVDWTADPVVLNTAISGDNSRYIPFSCFLNDLHAKENDINTNSIHAFVGSGPYIAALSAFLPFNATITRIKFWLNRDAATTVTMTLYQIPFGAGSSVATSVGAPTVLTTAAGAVQTLDTGVLGAPVVLNSANMYTIGVDATGGAGNAYEIYGALVVFHQ